MKAIGIYGSAEARGRLNGVVANVWRGIQYLKNHRNPTQPQTIRQQAIRANFATQTRGWQDLSDSDRSSWNVYASGHPVLNSIGQTVYLTGHQWYVGCSTRLQDMLGLTVDTPPVTPAPPAINGFAAANGVGQSILTWTSPGGTDKQAQVMRHGPHSKGAQGTLKHAILQEYEPAEAATLTVTGLSPGTHTFYLRVVDEDNGLVSPYVQDSATVT